MSYIQDYRMHIASAKDLVEKHGAEMVKSFFEDIFAQYEDLDMVFVYAYTPSFNDGDPCYHIQHVAIESGEIMDFVEEYLEDDADEEEIEEREINANISNQQRREIEDAIDGIEGLLEEQNGTDWYVFAKREVDGTISIQDGDYECGY
jgi:hypothetical protein